MRSTLERSRGLRLLPGAPGGFLGPPVTPGGSLGPPGASGYSRGPSGASWGLRLLPGALSLPAKPIWRWCGSVRVGAPLGSAGKKRAAPRRSFLSTPAREGASVGAPAAGVRPPPGLVPSLNIVKKSGGGLLESALWLRNRAQHVGAVAGPPVTPGAPGGFLGPPVTPGGSLGPPGASGYSRGPSGASWGLRLLPGALSLPAKPIWRWCGSVRVGAPLGSAGKKRAAPRALLPVDAGPRGGERRRPRGGRATAPWACPSLNIVKKSGGGLLESALWLRNRAQHVGAVAGPPVTPGGPRAPGAYSQGASSGYWGLLGPPVTPGALSLLC